MKKIRLLVVVSVLTVLFLMVGCIFLKFGPPNLVYMRPGNGSVGVSINALLEWKFEADVIEGASNQPTIARTTLEFGPKGAIVKIGDYYASQGTYDPDLNYDQEYEWRVTAEDSTGKTKTVKYSFTVETTP